MRPRGRPISLGPRAARATGAALVLASTTAVQGSAALSAGLFGDLGPTAVAGLRQLLGALALLLLVRPRLQERTRREWVAIVLLGAAMAPMNVTFYQAVALLPLGVAATLLYLGPFALAAVYTPRGPQLLLPVLALVGVALIARPSADVDALGLLVGLLAAAALAAYTLASQRLGRSGGVDSLALATAVSALLLVPASLPAASEVRASQWGVLALAGVLGVTITFLSDFTALRLAGTRLVAVLFALDPVMGSVLGALMLGDTLTSTTVVGIAVIVLTGAVVTAITEDPAASRRPIGPADAPAHVAGPSRADGLVEHLPDEDEGRRPPSPPGSR